MKPGIMNRFRRPGSLSTRTVLMLVSLAVTFQALASIVAGQPLYLNHWFQPVFAPLALVGGVAAFLTAWLLPRWFARRSAKRTGGTRR